MELLWKEPTARETLISRPPDAKGGVLRVRVRVRLFASLREEVGSDVVEVEVGESASVGGLLEAFRDRYPEARGGDHLLVAVNQEIADRTSALRPEDEVALLPPVSGG